MALEKPKSQNVGHRAHRAVFEQSKAQNQVPSLDLKEVRVNQSFDTSQSKDNLSQRVAPFRSTFFGSPMSQRSNRPVGLDLVPSLVQSDRANAQILDFPNHRFSLNFQPKVRPVETIQGTSGPARNVRVVCESAEAVSKVVSTLIVGEKPGSVSPASYQTLRSRVSHGWNPVSETP